MRQYTMKRQRVSNRPGFTLTELAVTVLIATIVILGMGAVLADSHRGWNKMYDRVHGEVVTDGYVATRAFDAVCRKSSMKRVLVDIDGGFVEVYYYQNLSSTDLDRYARFYVFGQKLWVDYGQLDSNGNTLAASSTVRLARNVTAVNFSVVGASVQMVLRLNNTKEALTITSLAIRHNE